MGERLPRACAAGVALAVALTGCASSDQGSVAAGPSSTTRTSSTSAAPSKSAAGSAKESGTATRQAAPSDDGGSGGSGDSGGSGGSGGPAGPAGAAGAGGSGGSARAANVAWMESFCGEVLAIRGLKKVEQPQVRKGDTAHNHKEISAYIGRVIDEVSAIMGGMKGLPQAPVPAGDKAVQNLVKIFASTQDSLRSAKAELDRAAPTDEEAIAEALDGVRSAGKKLEKDTDPIKVLKGSGLIDAAKKAPSCTKLV